MNTVAQYEVLMQASNTGAWEFCTQTNHLICNEIYFSLLGRCKLEFDFTAVDNVQNIWTDLLHPDDAQTATDGFTRYIANPDEAYDSYFRMKHKDGRWIWIWSRGRYLKDEIGNLTDKIIGTHVDVTRHKQTEDEIQSERILLRTLIDNLPDSIYVKDNEGRKIIANCADLVAIGAATEAEVIGKNDLQLYPNHIGERGYRDDMELLKSGEPITNKEEFFYDSDGNKQWLLTSKVPVRNANGNIVRILGIGHNITERKKAEEGLKLLNQELNQQSLELSEQAEELKALNEELVQQKEHELEKAIAQGKFEIASEVLHDIGNALVGFGSYLNRINRAVESSNLDTIQNLTMFLKNQQAAIANSIGADKANALVALTEGISKTLLNNKAEISSSIQELLNITSHVQEILNIQRQFVRGHSGVHERKPVNLANIIEDCTSMMHNSIDKKGIALKVDIENKHAVIKGDPTKLMQVMLNVLKNSVEAIPFEAPDKRIGIVLTAAHNAVEIKVSDNGQGFSTETGKRFFERGFTTKVSGTGLGLYNCKSIVESHCGSFELNSEGPGKGSVTTIRFSETVNN
jgi:PAS domain S-box-containing protein